MVELTIVPIVFPAARLAERKRAMKISVDIDCTPEEARRFLGLPDVTAANEALMAEVQNRMLANLRTMDPETLMKTWLPIGLQGMEAFQKMLLGQMAKAGAAARQASGTRKDPPQG